MPRILVDEDYSLVGEVLCRALRGALECEAVKSAEEARRVRRTLGRPTTPLGRRIY